MNMLPEKCTLYKQSAYQYYLRVATFNTPRGDRQVLVFFFSTVVLPVEKGYS